MSGNAHVRCEVGENPEMISKDYLSLFPKIESAEMMFSAARSRRLQIVPVIQSFAQLERNYGKESADIIIDNVQLTLFGGFAPNSSSAEMRKAVTQMEKHDIYQKELPHRAVTVYVYLADRTNWQGECWPAISTIARDLKLSPSTVRRALRDLRKAGLLESEQRYRDNGDKSSLLYKLDAQ